MTDPDTARLILIRQEQILDALERESVSTTPRLLSVRDAAEALGVSPDTVRRMIDRREIRYVQAAPGATVRIRIEDLRAWIDRHSVAPVRRRT